MRERARVREIIKTNKKGPLANPLPSFHRLNKYWRHRNLNLQSAINQLDGNHLNQRIRGCRWLGQGWRGFSDQESKALQDATDGPWSESVGLTSLAFVVSECFTTIDSPAVAAKR